MANLYGLGKRMFEDQVRESHEEDRDFYNTNPEAAKLSPYLAYKARLPGPDPSELAMDPAGMRAWFGLLGRNVKLKGGPSAPGSNQIRGTYAGPGEDKRDYPAGVVGPESFDTPQGMDLLLDESGQNLVRQVKDKYSADPRRYDSAMKGLLRSGQLSRRR